MPGKFQNSNSRVAGSILASTFVLLVGVLGATFVAAIGGGDPVWVLIVLGGGLVLFIGFFWLLSNLSHVSPKACYNWVFSKQARPDADYEPRRRSEKRSEYGTNHPSSVEDLEDLKDDTRTWVPSNVRQGRSEPR